MRRWEFMLFACLLAGCGGQVDMGAGDPRTAANRATIHVAGAGSRATDADDTRAWQGTWKLVSCISNGESQKADMQWIVKGDRYTIRLDRKSGTDPYPFKLDSQQKHIDVHHHDTPKGTYGGHLKGIYEIQGNTLKVCYDLKGQRYPDSFDAGRGSSQVFYQFQRQ